MFLESVFTRLKTAKERKHRTYSFLFVVMNFLIFLIFFFFGPVQKRFGFKERLVVVVQKEEIIRLYPNLSVCLSVSVNDLF